MDFHEMDSEDEFDEEAKPRLNMSHGFIHHIRRNQIERDNYDKKVKAQPKLRGRQKIEKKPESKLYSPPNRINSNSKSNSSVVDSPKKKGKSLFKLEYTSADGSSHTIMVKQGQDAKTVARRFANQAGIPNDLLETLEWKIEQEQIMRTQ